MDRQDRRRYFRINDWVVLKYRPFELEEPEQAGQQAENLQIEAAQILKSIDKELNSTLSTLWQNSPTTAGAIALLNKKIDIIAAEVELDYAAAAGPEQEAQRVSISACGIAFECAEQFDIGQRLDMQLTLKPANTNLKMVGQVVAQERTEEGSAKPYFLRVNFENISASVQEELIQHIVRRQSRMLGQQREGER